ncbi:MAG: radical SAM protein [Phycisphaerales bacterium]|nr:MAG: radical SAM protein [Phycisphaerales bacterium]
MARPDLSRTRCVEPTIDALLEAGCPEKAAEVARERAAGSLSDLGLALLARGPLERAVETMQSAVNLCPASQIAYHNLIATLLRHRQLRAGNLDAMARFVGDHYHDFPWVRQYRPVLLAPRFVNVEFVNGQCNLKCRMCLSSRDSASSGSLSYLSDEDFETMLTAVPTISALTLSAGSSDPLLHPQLDRIIDIAGRHNVALDIYTNGHRLTARLCRKMVESQSVQMINVSIDVVTPESYRRIRGADLKRVVTKIEMLQAMKTEEGVARPGLSLSSVAMADTIQDLPDLVRRALQWGAFRVFVQELEGWEGYSGENRFATENPRCFEYVREAQQIAAGADLELVLPDSLRCPAPVRPGSASGSGPITGESRGSTSGPSRSAVSAVTALPSTLSDGADGPPSAQAPLCCSWLRGVWVSQDGRLHPCCMVTDVVDMGTIHDGPLLDNEKYLRVKGLLLEGRVFKACLDIRNCQYVRQRRAAGKSLHVITRRELGDLQPDPAAGGQPHGPPGPTDGVPAPPAVPITPS